MIVMRSKRPARRLPDGPPSLVESIAGALKQHVAAVVVAAIAGGSAIAYSYLRHQLVSPSAPTTKNLSGKWWINIGGSNPGEMTLTQEPTREIRGSFQLASGDVGTVRGRYDGHSFYNVSFERAGKVQMFLENGPVMVVGDCVVVNNVNVESMVTRPSVKLTFSARGCE